jgi:hypothetical protein
MMSLGLAFSAACASQLKAYLHKGRRPKKLSGKNYPLQTKTQMNRLRSWRVFMAPPGFSFFSGMCEPGKGLSA